MNQSYTKAERLHVERVKNLPCSVCDQAAPSEAHHIKQKLAFSCIPLCYGCHRGKNGIHGDKAMWKIVKMDEIDALCQTFQFLTK